METISPSLKERDQFNRTTRQIERLILGSCPKKIIEISQQYVDQYPQGSRALQIVALTHYLTGHYKEATACFTEAANNMNWDEYPTANSVYSQAYIQSQQEDPSTQEQIQNQGRQNFQNNLAALRIANPDLADQLDTQVFPGHFQLFSYWGGLHLYDRQRQSLRILDIALAKKIIDPLTKRNWTKSIGIIGLNQGRELPFCLQNRADFLYGMTVGIYGFYPDAADLRVQLCLADISQEIKEGTVILMGANNMDKQIQSLFGSYRHRVPEILIGNSNLIIESLNQAVPAATINTIQDRVESYYHSEAFRRRQQQIAEGKIQPRILIETSRWTTFLQYCAADFKTAFNQLGCETRLIKEESNIQRTTNLLQLDQIDTFHPDAYFMVSFARTSMSEHFPRQLPFIAYLQDRCDPLWSSNQNDLSGEFSPEDLLICLVREYQEFLTDKKIPQEQTMILPVPVDENMFYPLEGDHPLAGQFSCDASYTKHGGGDTDTIMSNWLHENHLCDAIDSMKVLNNYFHQWYDLFRSEPQKHWSEHIIHQDVDRNLGDRLDASQLNSLHQIVTSFATIVYTACRRRYFLEGFIGSDLDLKLYGHGWEQDRLFGSFAGGVIQRDKDLIGVYNFSRINLHMQPYITMHQRVVECGLAGGFMMIADLPQEEDWGRARDYFEEDKEIVFYQSREDLIDKCRYYLEHPAEREAIAQRFRQKALAHHTVRHAADNILRHWRKLLQTAPSPQ